MLYLISYDIADDRRRTRLAESLKDFGRRVQFSVFECELDGAALLELRERIEWEVGKEDSCRIYRLCGGCAAEVVTLGREDPGRSEYWII